MNRAKLVKTFEKMCKKPIYRFLLYIFGIFTLIPAYLCHRKSKSNDRYSAIRQQVLEEFKTRKVQDALFEEALSQIKKKNSYFKKDISDDELKKQANKICEKNFQLMLNDETQKRAEQENISSVTFFMTLSRMLENKAFFLLSVLLSFPMYLLILIYENPYAKYIVERLFMMVFVLFGVTWLVFTILYISPMDPAMNILGQEATQEQIANFRMIHGLDEPYIVQLFHTFKKLITFDLGTSYLGNEMVSATLSSKFPVTLQVAFWSVLVSVSIAIPAGIISAMKPYSSFDYIFMFIALIGLSIPNFWLGLILILEFSIKAQWLPATYQVGNWLTMIMPAIVLGTGMSASVARMTRSSMLEVKNSDYILTARAKGLAERKVVLKHILGNAMIPIITVIGMQFGGMLGGSAVTEKTFNINGIGSFIVERQFIPDVPVVLAGVVYVAVIISIANLVVDIMYAFIDPRIKSKMKNY